MMMESLTRSFVTNYTEIDSIFDRICQLHEAGLSSNPAEAELANRLLPALMEQYELYIKLFPHSQNRNASLRPR